MTISSEKLAYIIEKAREFDAEVAPITDRTSAEEDEGDVGDILEATRNNPTYQELIAAIEALNCPASAPLRHIAGLEERRVLVSS